MLLKLATISMLATSIALPAMAQSPNPSQMLQGLLSGNQNQDQAVRDAYERGYSRGRQDQQRADRDDRGPPPDRSQSPYGRDPGGYQPNPYSR